MGTHQFNPDGGPFSAHSKRTSLLRVVFGSVAVTAMVVLVAWAATRAAGNSAPIVPTSPLLTVRVAPVTKIDEIQELRWPGTTRAVRRAKLSFVVDGRLMERPVDLGEQVEQGMVLARLDPHPFQNGVRAAEAVLAEARVRLEQIERDRRRVTRLHTQGIASRQRLEKVTASEDELRASLQLAQSRLREARRQLAEATLVAPFDATVTRVHLEPGEYAQAGAAVIAVSGNDGVELQVEVPESVASSLTEGQEAHVNFPLAGTAVPARLTSVSRGAEGPGRLFPIVAELQPTSRLIPGMAGELVINAGSGRHLAVPLAAIIDPSGKHPYVFRIQDGRAERVAVEVRTLIDDNITVTAALQTGDSVVVAGHGVLLDGDAVEVR